jgi:hypothetical protein
MCISYELKLNGIRYDGDELVNKRVASIITGLSVRTIETLTAQRGIPAFKVLSRVFYRVSELYDWVESNRIGEPPINANKNDSTNNNNKGV